MLATPPTLTRLTLGTPLLVYISMSDDAINTTIGREATSSIFREQGPTRSGEKVPKNRKGCPHPHNHLEETSSLLSGVPYNCPDKPAHQVGTQETKPSCEDGSME
ncbi:hypothetical protein CR513_56010, partial [Mucuna pruriens]